MDYRNDGDDEGSIDEGENIAIFDSVLESFQCSNSIKAPEMQVVLPSILNSDAGLALSTIPQTQPHNCLPPAHFCIVLFCQL
eukprot:9955697-Ditylum_brightwellii.AAC.1